MRANPSPSPSILMLALAMCRCSEPFAPRYGMLPASVLCFLQICLTQGVAVRREPLQIADMKGKAS